MQRDTLIQLVAALVMALCLAASIALATQLTASGGRHKLGYTEREIDNQPPRVALGIAMGAFRGIFVNMLWVRAHELKEAGKYHEAIDLASTITRLQPRFPQVWVFHAWNMSYNISVSTQTPEERWQWVNAGIDLLRREGIPANPQDLLIHKELAWIFLHKVAGYTDDANPFYKRQLAGEWQIVLGPPPPRDPDIKNRDAAIARHMDWLAPIARSPDTLAEVEKREPRARHLVRRLRDDAQLEPGFELLRWYEAQRALERSGQKALIEGVMGPRRREFSRLYRDPANAPAWDALVAMVRKRILADRYNMEPQRMIRYTRKYGPIDWRHPAAHGLYWGARGVEEALPRASRLNERDFDFANTDRLVIQCVQELWRSGDVYFDFFGFIAQPDNRAVYYAALPNVQFVPTYGDIIGELVERSWADQTDRKGDVYGRVYTFYAAGYENFLIDVVRFFYRRGQLEAAGEYYEKLRYYPGRNINDPEWVDRFARPLDEFVEAEVHDRFTSPNVAREEVVGALQGAFAAGLLAGESDLFWKQFDYARRVHRFFFEQQRRLTIDADLARMDQMPPDFRLMAGVVFANFIAELPPDDAERVYDASPDDLKVFAFDILRQRFQEELDEVAKQGGRAFAQVFPEPPGLEDHRRHMQEVFSQQQSRERGVEIK